MRVHYNGLIDVVQLQLFGYQNILKLSQQLNKEFQHYYVMLISISSTTGNPVLPGPHTYLELLRSVQELCITSALAGPAVDVVDRYIITA